LVKSKKKTHFNSPSECLYWFNIFVNKKLIDSRSIHKNIQSRPTKILLSLYFLLLFQMPEEHNHGPNYGGIAWKYFKSFLIILHGLVDCAIDFFFGLYYNDTTRKYIPSVDHPYMMESAMSIARKIRNEEACYFLLH